MRIRSLGEMAKEAEEARKAKEAKEAEEARKAKEAEEKLLLEKYKIKDFSDEILRNEIVIPDKNFSITTTCFFNCGFLENIQSNTNNGTKEELKFFTQFTEHLLYLFVDKDIYEYPIKHPKIVLEYKDGKFFIETTTVKKIPSTLEVNLTEEGYWEFVCMFI